MPLTGSLSHLPRLSCLIWRATVLMASLLLLAATMSGPAPASAAPLPPADPFYTWDGPTPLAEIAPGTVLKQRGASLTLTGVPLPVASTQVLYRTTDQLGRPSATVATVIKPLVQAFVEPRVVSYQFAYDSLSAKCNPSYVLASGSPESIVYNPQFAAEIPAMVQFLLSGYTVVTSDYEGQGLHWVAGHESGRGVLDGIRAAIDQLGLPADTKVGMIGYSGGGIASGWAAELAATYAPELRSVGTSASAWPVHLAHNYTYADGSLLWASILPAVILGVGRAFEIDTTPYLNEAGRASVAGMSDQCIGEFFARPLGLRFSTLLAPPYKDLLDIPAVVHAINTLIAGRGTPNAPMHIRVGNADGTGDGVMVAADLRALARAYCGRGVSVDFAELPGLEHFTAAVPALAAGTRWLGQRFTATSATGNCASIPPGNDLSPLPEPASPAATERATVIKVKNGRAIKLRYSDGRTTRVRLVGVKAPVSGCGAKASRRSLAKLAPVGSSVVLAKDSRYPDTTARGRSWRYVSRDGVDAGRWQLKRGWGKVSKSAFDRRRGDYLVAQRKARHADRGLWGRC